ncbi:MAG: fibronectin type III domain-containing protein, partial [Bacteroidales bacterium]
SCDIPTGLTRLASTTNSMTFDWDSIDDANCLGWLIDYKTYEDENWQTEFAATHPHTLSTLNPNIVYNIRLRAICSSGDTTFYTNTLNFGMPCDVITTFPWNESFENVWWVGDGLGNSTDSRPWCWININGGTQANGVWRKTTTSSYVRTGTGALQMYSGSTSAGDCNDWFITPVMTLTGNERLQFWAKGLSSYTDEFNIQIFDVTTNGAITSAADTSLFTVVMPDVIVPASDWTPYEVSLTQFIGDYQIAFVRNTTGGYYLNIDDISVSPMPQCARPSAVTLNNITANSADVDWIPANTTDFAWWVYYKEVGTAAWDSIYAITYPVNISTLTENTEYEVEIRTDCGYQLSLPSFTMTFRTACVPISTFPHLESFDTYGTTTGSFPSCWSKITTYSNYPYINATHYSSPGSMYFYANSGNYNMGSVELAPWVGIDSLHLKIQLRVGSTASKCIVGVMSDANDATTFVGVDTLSMSTTSTWQEFEIFFTNYTGTGKHIAFKSEYATATNYFYIDDLVIDYIPACAKPLYLNVSNTTATSTDISWTPVNQNSWWLYWRNKMTNVLDSAYVSGMTTHNIINLTPNTEYEYYLITDCLTELSESSSIESFTTPCLPEVTLPWIEGFETYGSSGSFPPCWSRPIMYSTYPKTSTTASRVHGGTSSLEIHSALTPPTYAVTPAFAHNIDSLRVKFWAMAENITSSGTLEVGIMSDPADTSTFESVEIIQPLNTAYNQYEVHFTNTTLKGMDRYIAFRQNTNSAFWYYWIDDVEVDYIPTCPKPVNQAANNITTNSAEISWTSISQATTSWWLYWRETTASNFDSVLVTNDTLYNLSNLNSGTEYEYYLISDCNTEISEPTNISTFFTPCVAITTLPWTDYFDSYGTGSTVFPPCWTRNTTYSNRPYVNSSGSYSTPGYLYFYAGTSGTYNIAATPPFDQTINLSSLKAVFKYKTTNSGDQLLVGIMTDPNQNSTFVSIDTLTNPTTNTWYDDTVQFASYNGTGKYIAFKIENTGSSTYARIDDLEISYNYVCAAPTNVVANNIATTSADISWTAGGSETGWQIREGLSGAIVNLVNTQYQVTGLTPNTAYTFYVRSDCGSGAFSAWVAVNFTTDDMPVNPVVTTSPVTAYTHNTATFTGSYTEGSDIVTAIGFDYKEGSASTWTNTPITPLANPFNYSATGLIPNTAYKVRAYATTSAGTFYGDSVNFTTDPLLPPTVTTDTVITNTNAASAVFQGTTSQGTDAIIARGFEYKLLADAWTSAIDLTASGSANITATATGLSAVKYQVRAYAETLDGGKTYGDILDFNMGSSINPIDTDNLNVNLYPNPASSEATLSIKGINGKVKISITDVQGRSISTIERESSNGEVNHSINLEAYAKGVYYIRIQS